MGRQDNKDDDSVAGTPSSGEGASSAMEAMLKKRQMRVEPQSEPAAPPTSQQQDGPPAKE